MFTTRTGLDLYDLPPLLTRTSLWEAVTCDVVWRSFVHYDSPPPLPLTRTSLWEAVTCIVVWKSFVHYEPPLPLTRTSLWAMRGSDMRCGLRKLCPSHVSYERCSKFSASSAFIWHVFNNVFKQRVYFIHVTRVGRVKRFTRYLPVLPTFFQ